MDNKFKTVELLSQEQIYALPLVSEQFARDINLASIIKNNPFDFVRNLKNRVSW